MSFELGPFVVHYYGIILMVGAVAAAMLAAWETRRWNEDSEVVWDALAWVLIGGVVGARIWHIFTPPPSMVEQGVTTAFYLTHPLDAIAVWRGGLGIPGAVIGGGLAIYIFTRRQKLEFAFWADISAPAVALGQAIGRWGNFVNQELYGLPTELPWGISIDPANRVPGYEQFTHFHPLFLYESFWNLANLFFLLWLGQRFKDKLRNGDVFLVFLVTYPVGRFFIEFIRLDSATVAGLNANQTLMLVVAIASAALLYMRHRGEFQTKAEYAAQSRVERKAMRREAARNRRRERKARR
jgi:phosphatidylglycerol:prolipoprotein diacylglycerol transferase